MWIRQLEVQHFAGIRSASLTFGRGLNVLHGRNELGKSSLVHAIRAALLLPDSSSARKDLVDWHTDQPPQVTLVFETEPHRIWRVRKSFGSGSEGWSYLEFSKDGVTFGQEAKGREVDGRLRELLRWGIEGPGGRGGRKGLPESFLATALLAEQGEVEAVLGCGLDDDGDDSGRQRLTDALQALAEDPAFRRIVEATQARVDEAFTATGRRRSGRGSPWVELRDQRQLIVTRRAEVNAQVEESTSAELRVAKLREEIDASHERVTDARASARAAEGAWEGQEARRRVEERVQESRAQRDRIADLHTQVTETEAELAKRQGEFAVAEECRKAAHAKHGEAAHALEKARERLQNLASGDVQQKRRLREEQIQKALAELAARMTDARARREQAAQVGVLVEKAREAREDWKRRSELVADAEKQLEEVQRRLQEDAAALEAIEEQQRVLRLLAARQTLARAEKKAKDVDEQQALALKSRLESRQIREAVQTAGLPGDEEMRALESHARELEVAEATLEVGLSVTVHPLKKLDVAVEIDVLEEERGDEEWEGRELAAGSETTLEARRHVTLRLKDIADVVVLGGSAEQRAVAKKLREEWEGKARGVLARAKADNLEGLQEKARAAAASLQDAAALVARAKEIEAKVQGAGDVQSAVDAAGLQAEQAETRVIAELREGDRLEDVVQRWDQAVETDDDEFASMRQRLREVVKRGERETGELRQKVAAENAVLESKTPELEALRNEASDATAAIGDDWKTVQEAAGQEAIASTKARSEKQVELEQLNKEGTTDHDQASDAVDTCNAELDQAQADLDSAQEAEKESRTKVDELQGSRRAKREAANREDLSAAEEALKQRQVELESFPRPAAPITEDQLAATRTAVEQRDSDHDRLQSEYQTAEGALQQVGGQYVQERLRQVEESLEALDDRQHETELDYAAWQLLLEMVKDSEREDAIHLGKALVEPIATRMSELTQGRYEGLSIGPKLKTQNVEVAGESRELSSLSVGTREQLATVLRLTIAEAVKSVLVLDDQLVQSDAQRMECLVAFMVECAKEFQILVFTCRPKDYRIGAEGPVHYREIELCGVVERSGRGEGDGELDLP